MRHLIIVAADVRRLILNVECGMPNRNQSLVASAATDKNGFCKSVTIVPGVSDRLCGS